MVSALAIVKWDVGGGEWVSKAIYISHASTTSNNPTKRVKSYIHLLVLLL